MGQRWNVLADGFSFELERVGTVHEAVEDRVSECRVGEVVVPFVDGQLAGDYRGAPGMAFLDDFEQVMSVLGTQGREAPVIEDEDLGLGQAGQELGVATIGAADVELM